MMFRESEKIHFVGIGGVGMSGIAELLLGMGFRVSGSDIQDSAAVKKLKKLGARIRIGHSENNYNTVNVVVISSAVSRSNPEVKKARILGIPVIPRAEMLAELMRLKQGIAVAGTHGKTSTTSILGSIMMQAGLDPTTIIGGKFLNIGSNARSGKGEYLICEADESDGSFLRLSPIISIVTGIDNDHMDFYKDMDHLRSTFLEFMDKVPFYGFTVLNGDDGNVRKVMKRLDKIHYTYGFESRNDFVLSGGTAGPRGMTFSMSRKRKSMGKFLFPGYGRHGIQNAAASVIVAHELGVPLPVIRKGLSSFRGVGRRMEKIGSIKGITVYDDYAHHPTELNTTIKAFRMIPAGRRIGIFQPHRYSRTRALAKEFQPVFRGLDRLIVTDVYAASEKPLKGVTGDLIAKGVTNVRQVDYIPNRVHVADILLPDLKENDLVITFGAGDVYKTGREILQKLMDRKQNGKIRSV